MTNFPGLKMNFLFFMTETLRFSITRANSVAEFRELSIVLAFLTL